MRVDFPLLLHLYHFSPLIQKENFGAARFELHQLLSHQTIAGVPLLVVCLSQFSPLLAPRIHLTT